jgi:hypothetical protein
MTVNYGISLTTFHQLLDVLISYRKVNNQNYWFSGLHSSPFRKMFSHFGFTNVILILGLVGRDTV